MTFRVTKTYGHERGLSCAFRQPKASSHCSKIHGYALSFEFVFEAKELDENNWVIDFGGLKDLKRFLEDNFDHTFITSEKDPHVDYFFEGHKKGLLNLVVLPTVGCEAFAEYAGLYVILSILDKEELKERGVKLVSCTVKEHPGNSATWLPSY